MKQLYGTGDVALLGDNFGHVQPIAFDDGAVSGHRIHSMHNHMIGHHVDEDLRLDGDRVVATILIIADSRDSPDASGPVHRESLYVVAEPRAVADEVLSRVSVSELGHYLSKLGVDGRSVVALHEVLDDELPIGLDVIADPASER